MARLQTSVTRQTGLSLVELLIALTIGLLLLAGLTLIFVNSSEANRELQKTAQQIENGRYASDILNQDLHHAGYYGRLYAFTEPAAPFSPDPCYVDTTDTTVFESALNRPVQGYRAADLATRADISATTCDDKLLLTAANMQPGSDVLVIRRAWTKVLAGASTAQEIYLQATGTLGRVRVGTGAAFVSIGLFNKDGTEAPIRKHVVHVYFVAPCSVGSGANGVCVAGTDDTIPTLKRLELVSEGGATIMKIVPLVEGIEYMKIEYGIDNLPDIVSTVTGLKGDSVVDSYTPTPGDWTQVVAARVYLLARNSEPTTGHVDNKSYVLGSVTVAPADYAGLERFRRHTYTAAVRLINVAGRREIP
jgi:type IV pilus assembly protein PilW